MFGSGESFVETICKNCVRIDDLVQKIDNLLADRATKSELKIIQQKCEEQSLLTEFEKKTRSIIEEKLAEILKPGPSSENEITDNPTESSGGEPVWSIVELKTIKEKVKRVEEKLQESNLQEQRKNNIIVHRLMESGATTEELKRTDDKKAIMQLFKDALEINCEIADIKRIFRLGKFTGKERPLLIEFKEGRTKNQVMESLSKLKTAEDRFKGISISHDMTEAEREQCRNVVKEAKDKQAADQSGEWLYKVKGMPGSMRIVKLRKRN